MTRSARRIAIGGSTRTVGATSRGSWGSSWRPGLLEGLAGSPLRHDLIDFSGPVDEVDLQVDDGQGALRLEAKCHLIAPNKRLFLINARARERSRRRGAFAYVCTVACLGRNRVLVGAARRR